MSEQHTRVRFASAPLIRYEAFSMAADKTTKRKHRTPHTEAGHDRSALRQKSDPRQEFRFEPRASASAVVSVVVMSLSGIALGAGVYGQWFRADADGPHRLAIYLLAGGIAMLAGVALFGQGGAKPIRVGDAGVALEKGPSEIERIEWRDVTRLLLGDDMLTVQGVGTSISMSLKSHPQAASRFLTEARTRIPKRVAELDDGKIESVTKVDASGGEVLSLEPPQVAGQHCKASQKLIAYEKDARVCGRCGEVYHKDSLPSDCLTCGARL